MTDRLVEVDGVELCLETFGDARDPALLLIGGAGASMDWWDPELCARLAGEGLLVVRYDHRDTGRSATSPPGRPTYTAADLATDPLRVLDALGVGRAHLVGLSMGGGIAQALAVRHAERVRTLTLVATTPAGARTSQRPLPGMEERLHAVFAESVPEPDWTDDAAVVEHLVDNERPFAGSAGFDEARVRRIARTVVGRTRDVESSVANHWMVADGDGVPGFRLRDVAVPTLVLHGTADPLFPLAHGEALAEEIPGARLVALEGMGHEVPPERLWDVVVREIGHHARRSHDGR